MASFLPLAPNISYLPATMPGALNAGAPLSADVFVIQGKDSLWIFDVGATDSAAAAINALPGKKNVVLSHFHGDHTSNITRIVFDNLYVGRDSFRHYNIGQVIDSPVQFEDGFRFRIVPVPNSHCKGSLALLVNDEFAFLGDSTYPQVRPHVDCYNAQLLENQLKVLRSFPDQFILSHRKNVLCSKTSVLLMMESVLSRRQKNNPWINVGRD